MILQYRMILARLDTVEARLIGLEKAGIDCRFAFESVTYWRKIVQYAIRRILNAG